MTFPTEHVLQFIPGPVEVDEELRQIMAMPLIGHRNPQFVDEVQQVAAKLKGLFLTEGRTFFENAPGTAIMEAGIRNLVPRGAVTWHLTHGAFSERWAKVAAACGRQPVTWAVPWGEGHPASEVPAQLAKVVQEHGAPAAVCITHNETSTGVIQDLQALASQLREHAPDALILVDTVTSLGGAELRFDDWGIDLALAGTQKCLALPPGLAVFAVSDRGMERMAQVEERGFLLDFAKAAKGMDEGRTVATPCVPLVFALSRQLDRIAAEGLENRWVRHAALRHQTLAWAGEHGFQPFVAAESHRSPTVTCMSASGRDVMALARDAAAAGIAMDKGYGDLKGKTFRIGHMGDHTPQTLQRLLDVLAAAG